MSAPVADAIEAGRAPPAAHAPAVRPCRPNSLRETLRIFPFLVFENLGYRVKTNKVGLLFVAFEPLVIILLTTLVDFVTGKQAPPVGRSFILFYSTAIIPFYTFLHVAWRFRIWDAMPRWPGVSEVQLLVSHIIGEVLLKLSVLIVVYAWVYFADGDEAIPNNALLIVAAMGLLIVFGIGIGFVNAVISSFIPIWSNVFFLMARAWLLFSGGMLVADNLPQDFRDAVAWVPLTHAIILYRMGQYPNYPNFIFDPVFMVVSCVGMLFAGWIVERATRDMRNFK